MLRDSSPPTAAARRPSSPRSGRMPRLQRPALALAMLTGLAAAAPSPPAPTRWVEDDTGFLSPSARGALDARLEAYERATGHQIVVWIGKTIEGAALDDWAVRTFAAWKVGRKGFDDGIVIFVLADDRKIDIEVGYGLEDKVPDAGKDCWSVPGLEELQRPYGLVNALALWNFVFGSRVIALAAVSSRMRVVADGQRGASERSERAVRTSSRRRVDKGRWSCAHRYIAASSRAACA
jgi:hypothetical protein